MDSDHPVAELLSAPLESEPDLETLRAHLAAGCSFELRVQVRPDAMMVPGPLGRRAFPDPKGTVGMCGRLARAGITAILITPHVSVHAVGMLVRFALGGPEPFDEAWPGLYYERPARSPRAQDALEQMVEFVLEAPEPSLARSLEDSDPNATVEHLRSIEMSLQEVFSQEELFRMRSALGLRVPP